MEKKQIIGLDIGYGFTKATNGAKTAIFPSVAGDVAQSDFGNDVIKAGKDQVITLDGQEWFYGEQAQKHSRNSFALFARERTDQQDLMGVLFCAAMVELGMRGRLSLCTGLPVDWFADRKELEKLLLGEHTFEVDGDSWTVRVCRVAVVPQPFGSFFDQVLDGDGKLINAPFVRGKVGILDVGTFTCDLALSDGLEYVAKSSGSKTVAMSTVWRQVRDGIRERHGLEYDLHQIDHILRNGQTVTVQGQDQDIGDLVQPAVDALAQQVLAFARDLWGRARDFKRILLTGGGAYYIAETIKQVYPHALVLSEPHTGNSRGFLKYAIRKFSG
jgi:plasmid segregation protein ParM